MEYSYALDRAFMSGSTNCTYTSPDRDSVKLDLATLIECAASIPEPPKILVMDIKILRNSALPDNLIIISDTVADALEEHIKKQGK